MRNFYVAVLITFWSMDVQADAVSEKERSILSSLIVACRDSLEQYQNGIYRYPENDNCNKEIERYFELDSKDRASGMAVNIANLSTSRFLAARAGIDVKDGRPITDNVEDPFAEMKLAIEVIAARMNQ
jgi:hypothetical protein